MSEDQQDLMSEDQQDQDPSSSSTSVDQLDSPDAEHRDERSRPGRFRRWVLRPLFWGLALIAIAVSLLQLIVNTRYARDWARQEITTRVGTLLDRQVNITDLQLTLLPLSVEIWGLRIEAPEGRDDQPFIEVPWVGVDADLQALQHGVLRLQQIRVERPRIALQYYPDGDSNILQLHRATQSSKDGSKSRGPRRIDVLIDHVDIQQAEVIIDQESIKLSVSADEVQAEFQGAGHLHIAGGLRAKSVMLRLPNARPFAVSLTSKGSIQRGRIEVETATVSGPGVSARGHGVCGWPLENTLDKKCEFQVTGSTRGEKFAEIGYFPYLKGPIAFDGTWTWRPRTFGWRSKVKSPQLSIWDRQLSNVEGLLAADRYQIRLILDHASYDGGEIEGTVNVASREENRPILVDLDFKDVPIDRLLADQNIPVGPFAARVSGNVVYQCPLLDGRRGNGQGEVTVSADPELEGLPLSGRFPLRIDTGVIRAESIVLTSERQSLLASGYFDAHLLEGNFDYELASADVIPVAHALRLIPEGMVPGDDSWPQWLPTAGEGRFWGTVELRPGDPSTQIHLRLEKVHGPDLDYPHLMAGSFHLDRRGIDQMRIQLDRGDTPRDRISLLIQGRMPLVDRNLGYTDSDELEMTFDARGWPLTAVRPWLDFDMLGDDQMPMDGNISGHLDLHVVSAGSDGRMRAVVSPAVLLGSPLDTIAGRLHWDLERLTMSEVILRADAGQVDGEGTLTWPSVTDSGDIELDIDLRTAALEIGEAPLIRYLPRSDLSGEVAMTAHISGSRQHPRLELQLAADGLGIGSRLLEARPSKLDVRWADGRLDASGRLLDMLTLKGGGRLRQQDADLAFDLDGHDVAGLLELLYEQPPSGVDGTFDGELRIAGEADSDKRIDLALDRVEVGFRGRRLANLEPVTLRIHPDKLEIGSLYMEERATGSELFLTGDLGYTESAPLDLRLQAAVSNSWLRLYEPSIRVDGFFDVLGRIGGTLERPFLDGQGEVRAARIVFEEIPDFPHSWDNLKGLVRFAPEGIVIDHLEGEMAGGRLRIEGRADVPRRGANFQYHLQIAGDDMRVRYPKGWLVEGNTELTLSSLESGAEGTNPLDPLGPGYMLTGQADLSGLEYNENVPLGFTQVVQDTLLRRRLEVNPADKLLSAIQLNVEISGDKAFKVHNNLADMTGSVDLAVRGNLALPIFLGTVDLDPGGELVYSSVDYEIDRGRVIFADPTRFNPEIDLVATTRVRDFDILLSLTGTMNRLNAGFTSEPPLPALEVFELLATGGDDDLESNTVRRANEIGQEQSMSAASFLYGQAAEVIGSRVSNLFGFDKFRIAPLTGSGDNLSKARVTVGKRLSKDLFLSYSADPTSTEEQRLQIEWQVGRGLVLVLTQNGDNTYEADARWETSF